jgi:ribosomal protein S18 acetylase RimI-like enzyme
MILIVFAKHFGSTNHMIVAPADLDDAASIATIHIRSWQAAYVNILDSEFLRGLSISDRIQRWRATLKKSESRTLVATVDDQVLGFVNYGDYRDEGASSEDGEIWALYADPKVWRQGVGRALAQRAIQELRELGKLQTSLWVFSQNRQGINFYQSLGFMRLAGSEKTFELGGRQVEEVCMRLRHDS